MRAGAGVGGREKWGGGGFLADRKAAIIAMSSTPDDSEPTGGAGGEGRDDERRGRRRDVATGQGGRRGRGARLVAVVRGRGPADGAGPAAAGVAHPVRLDGLRPGGLAERLRRRRLGA